MIKLCWGAPRVIREKHKISSASLPGRRWILERTLLMVSISLYLSLITYFPAQCGDLHFLSLYFSSSLSLSFIFFPPRSPPFNSGGSAVIHSYFFPPLFDSLHYHRPSPPAPRLADVSVCLPPSTARARERRTFQFILWISKVQKFARSVLFFLSCRAHNFFSCIEMVIFYVWYFVPIFISPRADYWFQFDGNDEEFFIT